MKQTAKFGVHVLGLALDSPSTADKFLVVGVKPSKLGQLRRSEVGLRKVMVESQKTGWFVYEAVDIEKPFKLDKAPDDAIPDSLLPHSNVFVRGPLDSRNLAMSEATDRWNFVVHIQIDSGQQKNEYALILKDYGALILRFVSLVVTAGESEIIGTENTDSSRLGLNIVAPTDKGAFAILLEA